MDESTTAQPRQHDLVLPGDMLSDNTMRPGVGAYRSENAVYASQLGLLKAKSNYMNVISLAGRYSPRVGDSVIGVVVDIGPMSWMVDINSPYRGQLHAEGVPWKVEYGDTARHFLLGDALLVQVESVDESRKVSLTLKGMGLKKLAGGRLIDIPSAKVPRVIGKAGSMINLIKQHTRCYMFVGQNGRIWLDGPMEGIRAASGAIELVSTRSHMRGLTEEVEQYLSEAGRTIPAQV